VDDIEYWRAQEPSISIMVHPECHSDVVQQADYVGSTELIVKTITEAAAGSKWAVGTEVHLVNRLARENPDKAVFLLHQNVCMCSMMDRISLAHLAWNLESLIDGVVVNQVSVPDAIKADARRALERMLSL
jgi:quinolinate synthase